jgi:hypothetical protein
MAAEDFVSSDQFGDAMNEPGAESPVRPTMGATDHLGPQFAGLTGEPESPKARRANCIAGQSIHEYRTSPGSSQ